MDSISFHINGTKYEVSTKSLSPEYRLVDFIRDEAHLTGTKFSCREGGCGACVVSLKSWDALTGHETVKTVNSCLTPVLSCNGWNIATVEALGNKKDGLHPIQERMVHFSASQCGFCTSGMIMSMHSLMESKDRQVTSCEVDKILDGNICRCTGYRPILDAFKSLATDPSQEIRNRCPDIEDSKKFPCTFNCHGCVEKCGKIGEPVSVEFRNGAKWVTPFTAAQVVEVLQNFQKTQDKYRLVAGNTGTGVYKEDGPYDAYVDLGSVKELTKWSVDSTGITIGGGVTISEVIQLLNSEIAQEVLPFSPKVAAHMERIANVPVRNRATLAGNLMLKHAHREFPSDIFILLETLGTKIRIASPDESPKMYTILEFLSLDMYGKLILSFYIPQRKDGYFFRSFKISRRYQNAHAYVNAGFLFKLDNSKGIRVTEKPRILFGGIRSTFSHAHGTETFFGFGKDLQDTVVLQDALEIMDKEINPDLKPLEGSPEYRKLLPKSLLYKTVLEILNESVSKKFQSGGAKIERLISSGQPRFSTDTNENELYGPTRKLEAPAQSTGNFVSQNRCGGAIEGNEQIVSKELCFMKGEAEYLSDMAKHHRELVGVFVISTLANAKLKSIDASEALVGDAKKGVKRVAGVVDFVTARDIPGVNNAMPFGCFPTPSIEPIFVESQVSYAGQALGMILAETREAALAGVKKVRVEYENAQRPVIGIAAALEKAEQEGVADKMFLATFPSVAQEGDENTTCSTNTVEGQFKIGGQAHFHMETQGCICVPMEDGMNIYCGTQWIDHAVHTVGAALGVQNNSINMIVRRIGGSFGARITKATGIIAATAVAAHKLRRPVRVILDLETNLAMVGKRPPYLNKYMVSFDNDGRIGKLNAQLFCDVGYTANEPEVLMGLDYIQNIYKAQNWEIKMAAVVTNTPSNTFVRAPASTQAVALIELIMEHIAHTLHKDPLEVRMVNAAKPTDLVFPTAHPFDEDILGVRLIEDLKRSSDYEQRKREVELFNASNRWKKRGIALVPVRFRSHYFGSKYPVYVTLNHFDGTVSVSHGGIEIGQGINTKVAQTVAFTLKIPLDKIKVKPTDNFVGNNSSFTAAAITSEACCDGALRACKILNERMDVIRNSMENKNPTWVEVVHATYAANVSLSAHYTQGPLDGAQEYNIWLANVTEVEVDVLTGEYKVARVDILEDTGKSLSPSVDIGQIEGAYLMGQGLWTTEHVEHDKETGKLLTDRTWTYKVPESKDIPKDFRVKLFSSIPNPKGILGTKATGEPPLNSGVCVIFALKNAIDSARRDAGNYDWYEIEGPVTPQDILKYAMTTSDQFHL